jgi:hypothetical protein
VPVACATSVTAAPRFVSYVIGPPPPNSLGFNNA